ncbi:hypothetical protein Tco_0339419 [Tanacetum coccineum]
MKLTHLCFVDNLLLFCHGNSKSVVVLKNALDEFGSVSGLLPSFPKSIVFFGNVKDVNKVKKRIMDWKNKSLSFARRLQLIMSVVGSMQHIWNIINKKDSMWVRWVHVYKLKGRNFWDIPEKEGSSWSWKKILRYRWMFQKHVIHRIGNGMDMSLWFDNWHAIFPLSEFISKRKIYYSGLSLDCKVANVIEDGIWKWPGVLSKEFNGLNAFDPPILVDGKNDKVMWRTRTGRLKDFSVSVVWDDIRDHSVFVPWAKLDLMGVWEKNEDMRCVFCKSVLDSHDHLFFEYTVRLRVMSLSLNYSVQVYDAATLWNFHVERGAELSVLTLVLHFGLLIWIMTGGAGFFGPWGDINRSVEYWASCYVIAIGPWFLEYNSNMIVCYMDVYWALTSSKDMYSINGFKTWNGFWMKIDYDLFIFARGEVESARLIMESLGEFQQTSGLVLSIPKSMDYFYNVRNHVKHSILNFMPFIEGELPVKYLGVPFISSRLLNKDCKILVARVKNRIGDWKNKSLSFAGRLQLCYREMEAGVLTGKYESNKGGLAAMVKCIDGKPLGKDGKSIKDYRKGVVMESNQATTVVALCVNSSDPGIISVTKEGTTTVLGTNAHMKPIHAALVNVTVLDDDGNNSINKPAPNVELGLVFNGTNKREVHNADGINDGSRLTQVNTNMVQVSVLTNYDTTWKLEVKLLEVLWMISVHAANMGKFKARLLRF